MLNSANMVYTGPTGSLPECSGRLCTPSMRDTLRNKRASLESQLQEVNEAIAALDENPGVERVLDLITKTTRY